VSSVLTVTVLRVSPIFTVTILRVSSVSSVLTVTVLRVSPIFTVTVLRVSPSLMVESWKQKCVLFMKAAKRHVTFMTI